MTYDKQVIANFCTRAYWIAQGRETTRSLPNPMYQHQAADFGEFSRQDAYRSCWSYVHDLSTEAALTHADPLVRALAVADAKVGKRRLSAIEVDSEQHLLVRLLAQLRRAPDGDLDTLLTRQALAA